MVLIMRRDLRMILVMVSKILVSVLVVYFFGML